MRIRRVDIEECKGKDKRYGVFQELWTDIIYWSSGFPHTKSLYFVFIFYYLISFNLTSKILRNKIYKNCNFLQMIYFNPPMSFYISVSIGWVLRWWRFLCNKKIIYTKHRNIYYTFCFNLSVVCLSRQKKMNRNITLVKRYNNIYEIFILKNLLTNYSYFLFVLYTYIILVV